MIRSTSIMWRFLFCGLLAPHWSFASGQNWIHDFSLAKGQIEFHAIGRPKAIKIHGKSEASPETLEGKIETSGGILSGQISFSLNSLKTGIGLRDRHMKEKYLETNTYPKAILRNLQIQISETFFDQKEAQVTALPFSGEFEIHGIKHNVTGTSKLEWPSKDLLKIKGEFQINIKDFGIEIPSFMGVTVAETVEIEVDLQVPSNLRSNE